MSYRIRYFFDTLIICVSFWVVFLAVVTFMIRSTVVGEYMLPTFSSGQSLFVLPLTTYSEEVESGDVVVLDVSESIFTIIKRVIAVSSDTLEINIIRLYITAKPCRRIILASQCLPSILTNLPLATRNISFWATTEITASARAITAFLKRMIFVWL